MKTSRRTFAGILLVAVLLLVTLPAQAALGWVGSMFPAGGSTTTVTVPGSFTVYVQVYKSGVTEPAGQGANISCTLHWAAVPYWGGTWGTVTDTAMVFNTQVGNNDEYKATVNPGAGLYEFTAYCTDLTDNAQYWQASGNGRLKVDTTSGGCNSADQFDNNVYWNGLGHNSFDTYYRSTFGAVTTVQGTVTLRFRTCMDDVSSVPQIRLYNDRTNGDTTTALTFDGHGADASLGGVTYWRTTVSIPSSATILYYVFNATDGTATAWYRDDDPKFYGGGWGTGESAQQTAYDNSYQLTVYDSTFTTPSWLRNAIIYQILPDRFRNGSKANDPVQAGDWIYGQTVRKLAWNVDLCDPRGGTCPNEYSNQFYGGDLQGLIDELDTLQRLGVTTVYLNPIFQAPSNHLYDTQDYLTVDPYFGNLTTFQTLNTQAEARGIKLILDGVFNHTSSDSKYFDRYNRWDASGNLTSPGGPGTNDLSGACEATSSSWRSWFTFVAGTGKCYDGTPGNLSLTYWDWAGYDSLPKLVSSLTAVRNYIYASGTGSVARYWLNQGGDGWRFDVGGDVDPGTATGDSNGYWAGYRTAARTQYSDAGLLGEEWGDASAWLVGDQWDSVMNYRFRSAVLSWLFDSCSGNGCTGGTVFQENDSNSSSSSGSISYITPTQLDLRLKSIREDYPPAAWSAMMNLMGSHDTNRVRFLLKKISGDNAATALIKWKLAGVLAFTYPGAPTLYYGDEAGLAPDGVWDGTWWQDDPYNRAPYPWADEGRTPDTTLQEHFRKLAVLRGQYSVLRTGELTTLLTDDTNKVYAYSRTTGTTDLAVVALNRDSAAHTASVSGLNSAFNGTVLYDVLNCSGSPVSCAAYTVTGGGISNIPVAPLWGAVLVEGPLPPYAVSLAVTDHDLAAGASTAVIATVTDIGGQPVTDGAIVNFSQLSGGGSLSAGTATTTGGQASVSYTAPGTGTTVAALKATSGSYVGALGNNTVYTGYQADVPAESTALLTIGPATLDATAGPGVWVHKLGLGEPTVTAASFTKNPVGVPNPNISQQSTAYTGLHLDTATGVDEIEVRVNCNATCGANTVLLWFDATTNTWKSWDLGMTGQTGGTSGYVWGRVTATSTGPTLADLSQGIVIMGGNPGPTQVTLTGLTATAAPGGVTLAWETASEVDVLGFNVYVAEQVDGPRTQVNEDLIQTLHPGSPSGAVYRLTDMMVQRRRSSYYWLETVYLRGDTALYGPVKATTAK